MKSALLALLIATLALPAAAQLVRKADSNQPIAISADNLEVQQNSQVATFTGKVEAVQGDMRLKADTLKVFYRQSGGQTGPAPQRPAGAPAARPAPAAPEAVGGNSISRIEAYGNVFVSSPDETGTGEKGVYDVDKRTVVLEGATVVLTRGQNVLKGQRMTMNLETGQSVMQVAPGQRVQGLFMPGTQDGQPAPAAPAPRR